MVNIEALLSARLFLQPQLVGNRIYFLGDLNGAINLYVMRYGGSVPLPLLPLNIALQNPKLMVGSSYCVFPNLEKILVMIDREGAENYQPMTIPIEGGYPEATFEDHFAGSRVNLFQCDPEQNILYLGAESLQEPIQETYQGNLETGVLQKLGESKWGCYPRAANRDHTKVILIDEILIGDHVLYIWERDKAPALLYGTPLEDRAADQVVGRNGIHHPIFTQDDQGLLFVTALFSDAYGLGHLSFSEENSVSEIVITGTAHEGNGELRSIHHLEDQRYTLEYNIDGCTWIYEGTFNQEQLTMQLDNVLVGEGKLSAGVVESIHHDAESDSYALAFSSATSPPQIYTLETDRKTLTQHTNERFLGLSNELIHSGEDATFTSFDGKTIPARLYLPAKDLGFQDPRPLVYYIHGGPQSQERPDFTWFSMPLIHFLTLNGMAVFVPNVRGSTGYGLEFARQVDRDWGGKDRKDHVYAMTEVLARDDRLDITRAGVFGRSYGGYMTLTLASRHPVLWSAAVDMFGPFDLLTFVDRLPETWKPYFKLALGDPEDEAGRSRLAEMSPSTYIDQIQCPLLVIQGANDPRVVRGESRDLVDHLRAKEKQVDLLLFDNEGHDILKYENKVACYNAITAFFIDHLKP